VVNRDERVDAPKGTMEIHECIGKGAWPRPSTAISHWKGRALRGDYWVDADRKTHGAFRELMGERSEHVGFMLHGVEEGVQIDRLVGERGELRKTYRGGELHGLYISSMNSAPTTGYYARGKRTGTWLGWRSLDGAVKARLRYTDGALEGAQRWWFADGKVLARGTFSAGKGTWEIFGRDGRRRSSTQCDGRRMVETTAWDAKGKIVVHACGPAAPPACSAAVGPTTVPERFALGADPVKCEYEDVAPLSIFD
jgi:hypothetical protein